MNPDCPRCGDSVLRIWTPLDIAFRYVAGSPEIHRLFALERAGVTRIWACETCDHFEPAMYPVDGRRPRDDDGRREGRRRRRL